MAAEKGEEAEEKRATAVARAVEKGEARVKAADEEQGATAVEKGVEDSTAADEEERETEEGKGKKRETAAVEKESTTDWELVEMEVRDGRGWRRRRIRRGRPRGPVKRRSFSSVLPPPGR
jgi:S-phase kinase-associated protein 1